MITIRPGSHVLRLLQLLSVAGEFPVSSLSLLGNDRVIRMLVHKLESVQDFRLKAGGEIYHTKLIQVSRVDGKNDTRTIRLYRKAIPLLDLLYPHLSDYYLETFKGHSFSGDRFHIRRNHRVAEALAACMLARIEIRPYILPPLQKSAISNIVPASPSFYIARDFKKTDADRPNKTMFTRIIGALFYKGGCYAVYNTRDAVMKWSGRGELKAARNLLELTRMNAGLDDAPSALLFGATYETAMKTVMESDKNRRADMRFDRIYTRVHFVPLDQTGVRLLRQFVLPDWNEKLLSRLFAPEERSYNLGYMEYDATVNGRKILSHLDCDIARLIRFSEALKANPEPADVLCYSWQTEFLKSYLGSLAMIRELEMSVVHAAMGLAL